MKLEHKSPPISPQKPHHEPLSPLVPFYVSPQTQVLYGNTSLPTPQSIQAWTAFTTLESAPTQKVVMYYKTTPCPDNPCPRGKLCIHYHSYADRRRPLFYNCRLMYAHTMCPYITQGLACGKGDQCGFAHTNEENLYHPTKYKTSMCLQGPLCLRDFCPWAHAPGELRNGSLTRQYSDEILSPFQPFLQAYGLSPEASMPYAASYSGVPALDAELGSFKTEPCSYQYQHNHKHCIYYHSPKDRRRVPGHYSAERCEANEQDNCPLGDSCPKSHSMVERLYHPDKYKTKYCNNYPDRLSECEYGSYCCFAHSDAELKVELIHYLEQDEDFYLFYFKTGWCPFNHEHNKAACVYAHNWQDFRRKPNLFRYTNELCPNWQSETFISEYKEGCIYEHSCNYCHGWKEQLYHPLTYKALPCPDIKKCQKGLDCPYYHGEYDRRHPNKFTVYYPRPRNYRQNPNLTLTNNVNIQREYELQQLSMSSVQTSVPIGFVTPPAGEMGRRFSEDVQYKSPLVPLASGKEPAKHRASYDLTAGEKRALPKSSVPLLHIREESPESPREDDFFEIFQPTEDSKTKTSTTLFFSPKINKGLDPKRSAAYEANITQLQEGSKEGHNKSCPSTPLIKRQSFGRSPVFEKLHLDEGEKSPTEHVRGEQKRVQKFLSNIGLANLYPLFSRRNLTMNDLLIMTHDKLQELGIQSEDQIKLLIDKSRENLENNFEQGFESPGIPFLMTLHQEKTIPMAILKTSRKKE